jgi:hypothetical protein
VGEVDGTVGEYGLVRRLEHVALRADLGMLARLSEVLGPRGRLRQGPRRAQVRSSSEWDLSVRRIAS